ncbi:hypothetical protein CSOJ01_15833 [Colletotrichum sojae]|uniref:Uncharacterized protein n=1 Tax=Colletotrichum sojae TaxID=2175907 RepID=A0A8H6MIG5_9PEZI|nr:hypothetical protein CSOJ01_15833 [Colletotrichum sojae]
MAEAQAIARVHRIGQSKPVTATKYMTLNSVEEVSSDPLKYTCWKGNYHIELCC